MSEFVKGLSNLLNRETGLDRFAEPVQKAVSEIFKAAGPALSDFLNGTWLGHPLHPVITDVPVGAWTAAIALDTLESTGGQPGMAKAADTAVVIGVAGALGSAVSGLADWQHTVGESRRTGFTHATLNTVALGLFMASLAARATGSRGLGRTLALAGYGVVAASAYLGGDLVYRQRIGVDHSPEPETIETKGFVPVLAEDQLPENKLTIAMLNTTPLVLLRQGERVYALAETCAHLGGPLADGKLVKGPDGQPAVVCPWHGSCFDMTNGNALNGPTAYPQPCFDARIADGQVEVRRMAEAEPAEADQF